MNCHNVASVMPLAVLSLVLAGGPSLGAHGERDTSAYSLGEDGLALSGYDPVAYFDEGGAAATVGRAELSLVQEGVRYRFSSEAHRELFQADPKKYEPAYGGWCAYAMSQRVLKTVDPRAYLISEGRLTLFSDLDFTEFEGDWVPHQHQLLAAADRRWESLSGEQPRRAPKGSYRHYEEYNLSEHSLAMEGHDPVSYFPEGGSDPRKGSTRWSQRVGGVLYHFVNEKNLKTFRAHPERYEPAHGGWCSYAMGVEGEKVEVDPEAYRMTNGQLHLFFNTWYSDTRDDWDEDTERLKKQADANWTKLLDKRDAGR